MSTRIQPLTIDRRIHTRGHDPRPLGLIESLVDPVTLVVTLVVSAWLGGEALTSAHILLSILVFSLAFPGHSYIDLSLGRTVAKIFGSWLLIAALLGFFGYASRYVTAFGRDVLLNWLWLAPTAQVALHRLLRRCVPLVIQLQGGERRAVIVGMNAQGIEVARTLERLQLLATRVAGFFDDRAPERLAAHENLRVLGRIAELPAFVKAHGIHVIYLSLPMATQPRILDLLNKLRDTTASIYFVPDGFVTDLIQARMDAVGRIPVVAVCETPFTGARAVAKRASDLLLATLILVIAAPLMLAIAIGVKVSSPGPILFRQHRYGLDGREIVIYKFRSMTVCEDGMSIAQARRGDSRVTPFGALLRRTSLDELPQFFNVLQGRMSIVGPRPHAVAHNEEYRHLIEGYMVRHKVKPGITGWAQINGFRGETDTLDKMKRRIEYDLDYLRNWSLRFDLSIIMNTALLLLRDRHAY